MKRTIVIVPLPGALMMDTTAVSDAFQLANRASNIQTVQSPNYEIIIASSTPDREIKAGGGIRISCENSIYDIEDKIDTLFIGGLAQCDYSRFSPLFINWLRTNASKIRRICASGSTVSALAAAGLLHSSQIAIHWSVNDEFRDEFPTLETNTHPIFIRYENIYSCAGMSSAIDLSLALIEEDLGRCLAMEVGKSMVIYQCRPGTELQFSNMLHQQQSGKRQIDAIQTWIKSNLKGNLKIAVLADKAAMSPRNFARVFLAQTGISPGRYIEQLRLESSKRYLEETDLSIEQIAALCGFGNSDTMRKLYTRALHITPFNYRKNHFDTNEREKITSTYHFKNGAVELPERCA